jgi:hypothetical protein
MTWLSVIAKHLLEIGEMTKNGLGYLAQTHVPFEVNVTTKAIGVPKSRLTLLRGATSRRKLFKIEG